MAVFWEPTFWDAGFWAAGFWQSSATPDQTPGTATGISAIYIGYDEYTYNKINSIIYNTLVTYDSYTYVVEGSKIYVRRVKTALSGKINEEVIHVHKRLINKKIFDYE